jgi:hypothetical protein
MPTQRATLPEKMFTRVLCAMALAGMFMGSRTWFEKYINYINMMGRYFRRAD